MNRGSSEFGGDGGATTPTGRRSALNGNINVDVDLRVIENTSPPPVLLSKPNRPSQLPLTSVVVAVGVTTSTTSDGQTSSSLGDDCVVVRLAADDRTSSYPRIIENNRLSRLKIPYDTASKDSDSLIHDSYYYETETFDSRSCWWSHPKVRENWKIVLSAFVLLIIGTGLVATGFLVEIMPIAGFKGVVFFIAGAICLIPGLYHVVYVYFAVKGRRGFHFSNLPLFT